MKKKKKRVLAKDKDELTEKKKILLSYRDKMIRSHDMKVK